MHINYEGIEALEERTGFPLPDCVKILTEIKVQEAKIADMAMTSLLNECSRGILNGVVVEYKDAVKLGDYLSVSIKLPPMASGLLNHLKRRCSFNLSLDKFHFDIWVLNGCIESNNDWIDLNFRINEYFVGE